MSDSVTDFRKDGDQSLGERLFNFVFSSASAGVGDVAFTYAFKTISNMLKSTGAQKIFEYIRPKKIAEGHGLETKGYRPKPGERTTTREEWKALDRERRIETNYPKPTIQEKNYDLVKYNTNYYTLEGEIIWPPNRGVLGETENQVLS